ncbi:MAG TPA: ribose-5-phosphate isomerase RpiA [Ktedonobacterales bacterium]|nr:ribose-5-phosphate isomerase RpiA [Ktedonobacterales bacterium]
MQDDARNNWKRSAAQAAVAEIPDGALIGLGSGTTAELMLVALAARVRAGLQVTGVPTSERTRALASAFGVRLLDFDGLSTTLDMSLDGADEVTLPALDLIKGRGGALLHEKQIALASRQRIIIVDDSKLVTALGTHTAIPVEVVPFGWRQTMQRLEALGAALGGQITIRAALAEPAAATPPPAPFVTDSGNYILDCGFGPIAQPAELAAQIKALTGVVDHGLFIGMTERVYVGGADGVRVFISNSDRYES